MFHALTEEHLKKIVEIQLGNLRKRLADRHITLELTDAARAHLVRVGYDPSYGARPLKRAIQREIENPLARTLIAGEVRDGQHVYVDYAWGRADVFESVRTGARLKRIRLPLALPNEFKSRPSKSHRRPNANGILC